MSPSDHQHQERRKDRGLAARPAAADLVGGGSLSLRGVVHRALPARRGSDRHCRRHGVVYASRQAAEERPQRRPGHRGAVGSGRVSAGLYRRSATDATPQTGTPLAATQPAPLPHQACHEVDAQRGQLARPEVRCRRRPSLAARLRRPAASRRAKSVRQLPRSADAGRAAAGNFAPRDALSAPRDPKSSSTRS